VEQESTFWYLFGIKETNCYAVIENRNQHTTMFIPRLDDNYKMWMKVKTREEIKEESLVDDVCFVD
jgi:Xaa-Pro dipeptidase